MLLDVPYGTTKALAAEAVRLVRNKFAHGAANGPGVCYLCLNPKGELEVTTTDPTRANVVHLLGVSWRPPKNPATSKGHLVFTARSRYLTLAGGTLSVFLSTFQGFVKAALGEPVTTVR